MTDDPASLIQKYSVRILHLQTATPTYQLRTPAASGEEKPSEAEGSQASQSSRRRGRFQLPANTPAQAVKQTLVQMDVPPDITLKQEIPLPNLLLWTETKLQPMRKRFIAPPERKSAPAQGLPPALTLEPPNQEIAVSNLNIASALNQSTPTLLPPPAVASPVSSVEKEQAKEIPVIGLANSTQASDANLVAIANLPPRSATVTVPPVNQVAPGDRGNAGSTPGDRGNGTNAAGSGQGAGNSQNPAGNAQKPTPPSPSGSSNTAGEKNAPSPAPAKPTAAARNEPAAPAKSNVPSVPEPVVAVVSGTGPANLSANANPAAVAVPGDGTRGSNGGGVAIDAEAGLPNIPGTTRITQPRDGTFAAVVQGSSESVRYPASVGVLSGKVVYTVYLRVGLRKSWILQYCVPKNAPKSATGTPVEAPWPFQILRPDRWGSAVPDYVVVHGMLNTAGRFDDLAMVFPQTLETKDLLLNSLQQWTFRPATRDGQPMAVEIVLIIPRES